MDEKWIPVVSKQSPPPLEIFMSMPPFWSGLGNFCLTVSFLFEEMAVGLLPFN